MLLRFEDDSPFAQGACPYLHQPVTAEETTNRILVTVKIEGVETQAVVDTGGVWLVCDPGIAEVLELDPEDGIECPPLQIRGDRVPGMLHRLRVTFVAEEGESLQLQGTAFVPESDPHQTWPLPTFLGFHGCLERIRFAVNPSTQMFYFGPANEAE